MPEHFDLVVTADDASRTAEFRLRDAGGCQLAYHQADFKTLTASRRQGLFDLRDYLSRYVEADKQAASVAEIGVSIAEEVLGADIFLHLWTSEAQRTLRIQLPGATGADNHLAAALARVPWEIARPAADRPALGERNLVLRVVHDTTAPATQPIALGEGECLRVLFVFAEARGSPPLAARRERQTLRKLFETEIYPRRRIVAHFLSYGVTRERLRAQIQEHSPLQAELRQLKEMLGHLHRLPPEHQEKLNAMPPEIRALIDALPPAPPPRPDPAPLLSQLVAVGLITEERTAADDGNPNLGCHELVREQIHAWMRDHPEGRGALTENAIRLAYADRLAALFHALRHEDMSKALVAGGRAIVYCVQSGDWERLGGFAGHLVTSTGDPRLLTELLPHLELAAESAPEGKQRWSCLGNLADALAKAGRPDASLPLYEQATAQARAAAEAGGEMGHQAWVDVGWITGNWAIALATNGELDNTRGRGIESAGALKKGGSPAVYVIGRELEVLRNDILQDRAAQALPEVEIRLVQVENWWWHQRAGQPVPEAPDPEFLARTLIGALDIAMEAHVAQEDWEAALARIDAKLEVKGALQRPAQDMARDRGNRANVLTMLGRYAEAKAELEHCLQVFQNDPASRAKALGSIADLFDKQGDVAQAITQERRALALCEALPDPEDRAKSHNNLANYLERSGMPSALAESPRHRLADLVYCHVSALGQSLHSSLRNYAIDFRRAHAAGTALHVPRVSEILADPAFRSLDDWLRQRRADVGEVQAAVDQLLAQARERALKQD